MDVIGSQVLYALSHSLRGAEDLGMRSTIAMLRGAKVLSSGSAIKRLWPATQLRFLADDAGADAAPKLGWTEELRQKWKKVDVALDPPKTLSEFMKQRPPIPAAIPQKLTLNLVLPHQVEMEAADVDMVIIPASSGQMGVLPGHVPTIAELRPGVLSIHDGGGVKTQYFVSGGFALIHANSVTDIVAVEAAPLDRFDHEEVKSGLAEFTQKLNTATTDLDKAQAQIGVEVHGALSAALGL